jgi:hypothetical protein
MISLVSVFGQSSQGTNFSWSNVEDARFRECRAEAASYSFTDTYCWGDSMSKRNQVIFEEGGLEAMARLQEQDEEFCRRLRIRVRLSGETGP